MANQVILFGTEKGKEGLGYMGHVYRFGKRGLDGNIYWRCLLRDDCKGRLQTDHNKGNPQHNHVPNEDEVRVRSIGIELEARYDADYLRCRPGWH
jgi:hypothetical protein